MTTRMEGYFGGERGRSAPGTVQVTVSGSGLRETLTIEYVGKYQVIVPLRQVEQLAAEAQRQRKQSGKAVEQSAAVVGYYTGGGQKLAQGATVMWFWTDGAFSMLSVEFGSQGQISLPYKPVASLIRAAHINRV